MLLPDVCASAKMLSKAKQRSKSKASGDQSSSSGCSSSSSSSHGVLAPFVSEAGLTDDAFETRAKRKAQRKAKGKRESSEDILRPSSLELPYKPKVQGAKEMQLPRPDSLRIIPAEIRKAAELRFKAGRSLSFDNDSEPNSRRGSPPPVWDSPPRGSGHDEALAEIARQTESFALQHKEPKTNRPTSYSAAVAGSGLAKPAGTIGSASSGLASSRNPGVVGQKPPGVVGEPKTKPALPSHSWEVPLTGPIGHPPPLTDPTLTMGGNHCSAGTDPKQEIAPVLRDMCASFPPPELRPPSTEGSFSTWSGAPCHPGFTPWKPASDDGNAPPGLSPKPQWPPAHATGTEALTAGNRWSPQMDQRTFGTSESFNNSYWDPASPNSVWGSLWWSSPVSGAPTGPVESPTDSMADVVSSLGMDSPDASVAPSTYFDLTGSPRADSGLSHSIWAHPTARASHPGSYSLFQEDNASFAHTAPKPPLGWTDNGTL